MQVFFTTNEFKEFRVWLNLNLDGLTWQGRFKKEFEVFWEAFFEDNLSFKVIHERLLYAETESKVGSLQSWFKWLKEKFICYVYINKNVSIEEISDQLEISLKETSFILRNFFIEEYPHLDESLTEFFSVTNVLSKNINLKFSDLEKTLGINKPIFGSREEEIMQSMEITLYDEWKIFVKKMKIDFNSVEFSFKNTSEKVRFLKTLKIFQEVGVLIFTFILMVFVVTEVNQKYEKFLIEKVSIFEPKFNWLSKNILFKTTETKPVSEFKLSFDEIPDLSKSEKVTEFFDPEKYEEETEVTLSNFDSIPKDFNSADKEQSQYEIDAENPNGLRETKNGTVKIYRLMLTSSNTNLTKTFIQKLAKELEAVPVSEGIMGVDVPGGVYFNIQVPKKDLKNFLTQINTLGGVKIFESNTSNVKSSPGKSRVFIMIKSI